MKSYEKEKKRITSHKIDFIFVLNFIFSCENTIFGLQSYEAKKNKLNKLHPLKNPWIHSVTIYGNLNSICSHRKTIKKIFF